MALEFHLTNYERYRTQGLEAYRGGDPRRAKFCLLKSAEHLFQMANLSEGRLRDVRSRRAGELLEMAQGLPASTSPRISKDERRGECDDAGDADGSRFEVAERPDVTFDDIAGLESVKEEVRLKIIYPFQHRETASRFGVHPGGGILLYGPPGTGKTLMARAIAGETECAFFTVKPSDILSKWVGEAEQNFESLFAAARAESPSIIFIDEIDALAPKREETQSSVMARLVPQILAELEGFSGSDAPILFVGATNEPWSLDSAILRPGRFDEKIYVGLPDAVARRRVLQIYLEDRPLADDIDLDVLTAKSSGFSGADLRNLCRRAADDAFLVSIATGQDQPITQCGMLRALSELNPSVDSASLARFESYREEN